ncbi:hypothetical protein [Aestuariimicrobium ganziense]|uniref:hypothetical protein n=1 Tax=Aestuariimicrobium ganziense TaxID=2773677 RepID=UPI0019420725|nr:hypothetical protein [Aestuariimicrobium ganziense]
MTRWYVRTPPDDLLVEGGEAIALYPDRFVRLGPIGTWLVVHTETPLAEQTIVRGLDEAFGPPPGMSVDEAAAAALADLVAQRVLTLSEEPT